MIMMMTVVVVMVMVKVMLVVKTENDFCYGVSVFVSYTAFEF